VNEMSLCPLCEGEGVNLDMARCIVCDGEGLLTENDCEYEFDIENIVSTESTQAEERRILC
jgi:DnaJ-class molecular chaperone